MKEYNVRPVSHLANRSWFLIGVGELKHSVMQVWVELVSSFSILLQPLASKNLLELGHHETNGERVYFSA